MAIVVRAAIVTILPGETFIRKSPVKSYIMKKSNVSIHQFSVIRMILMLLTIFSFQLSMAVQPIRWTSAEGEWTDATSWSENRVPGKEDHVLIDNGTVTIPSGTKVQALSINLMGNGKLFVASGAHIDLIGNNELYSSLNLIEEAYLENRGSICIYESVSSGITIQDGLINNLGNLVISNSPIEAVMVRGNGAFLNRSTGRIEISGQSQFGFHLQQFGQCRNEGSLILHGGILLDGIFLEGLTRFTNRGLIHFLKPSGDNCVDNHGSFENRGKIIVEKSGAIAVSNSSSMANYGSLRINDSGGNAIDCTSDTSTFKNTGTVEVRGAYGNGIHLTRGSVFHNLAGSVLSVQDCIHQGVLNEGGLFINRSTYSVGRTPDGALIMAYNPKK